MHEGIRHKQVYSRYICHRGLLNIHFSNSLQVDKNCQPASESTLGITAPTQITYTDICNYTDFTQKCSYTDMHNKNVGKVTSLYSYL